MSPPRPSSAPPRARPHAYQGKDGWRADKPINSQAEQLARVLGWFRIGLGLVEFLTPRAVEAETLNFDDEDIFDRLKEMTGGRGPDRCIDAVGMEAHGTSPDALAGAMRQWLWLYPSVEIVHIVSFVVLVGAAVMFDLRLLGLSRHLPVRGMACHLLPWARASLALVVPSGLLMFTAHATEMAANPAFRPKLILLAGAGLNAALFHWGPFRAVHLWNQDTAAPVTAKLAAVASLVLWVGVLACGRLLAYF